MRRYLEDISNKVIGGKIRHYLQWIENGKTKSKYIHPEEYEKVKQDIYDRKELEKELKLLLKEHPYLSNVEFKTNVSINHNLRNLVSSVKGLNRRDCFASINKYIYSETSSRICSIYGLRRTGKTTLIFQTIAAMNDDDFYKSAYIKIRKGENMHMLENDLKTLQSLGYKYIFIDEITFMDDFIDTASILSDIYAAMGMKIVISGTDSLGIYLASKDELYDRTYFIHTTWIPFKEHSFLLNTTEIDEYIHYGGTLRACEIDFDDDELKDEEISFRDDESTRRYIDTAICGNIQHSLKCFENGTHFRKLYELFEAGELTNAINRLIENINHRFVIDVLTKDFKSNDFHLAKKNILKEKNLELRMDILEKVDEESILNRLKEILEIKNKEKLTVQISDEHVREIKEYLQALGLIEECPIRYLGAKEGEDDTKIIFTQPGMRYCQAEALVFSLKKDKIFSSLSEKEKDYVCNKILDEVKGRILEEIVIYETMRKLKKTHDVFKLEFIDGEFDMVTMNKKTYECNIFEIKHSKERNPKQYRHLINDAYCEETEKSFGKILGKYILYRGEEGEVDNGIKYLDVSRFLLA